MYMKSALAEDKIEVAAKPYNKAIDLGNGIMFPVKSEKEAEFVEWMIDEAKAGRASLPKRDPEQIERPIWLDTEPKIKREDWWPDYEYSRSERF